MRAFRRLALLCVSTALLSSGVAQADIAPIAKPPDGTAPSGTVAPLVRPQVKTTTVQVTPERGTTRNSATGTTSTSVRTTTVAVAASSGGREATLAPLLSAGGRDADEAPSAIARLLPTPLGLVGIHESLPSEETWPAWLLGAIALLASAEAFLLTRLARASRLVDPEELERALEP